MQALLEYESDASSNHSNANIQQKVLSEEDRINDTDPDPESTIIATHNIYSNLITIHDYSCR